MADNALIQSGQNLAQASSQIADISGAINKGQEIVQDQIDKNLKRDQEAEDREWTMKRRANQEQLMEMDLEQKINQYQADKGAYFQLIEDAQERGLMEIPDYEGYKADRDAWWKENASKIKLATGDEAALRGRLDMAAKGEENWQNVVNWSKNATISDSSPEAQKIDLAVDNMAKRGLQPKIITEGGKDYYELIGADGEKIKVSVDKLAQAEDGNIAGDYNEPVTFDGFQARFMGSNPEIDKRLRQGQGTKEDLAKMNQWFDAELQNSTQLFELADSFLAKVPNADFAAMGIKDIDGDGGITSADLDTNQDGEIDDNEKKQFRKLFEEITTQAYGQKQVYEQQSEGEYEPIVRQTYDAFAAIKANNGRIDSLLQLPNVQNIQYKAAEEGHPPQARIQHVKNGKVVDLIVETTADGTITPKGYQQLAYALNLQDVKAGK